MNVGSSFQHFEDQPTHVLSISFFSSQAIVLAILGVYLLMFTVMLIKLKSPTDYASLDAYKFY